MKRNLLLLIVSVVMVFSCSMMVACGGIDIETHRPTVTVTYEYENGEQAAETYNERYNPGEKYDIVTPEIEGYTPTLTTVSGTMDKSVEVKVIYSANKYDLVIKYTGAKNNPTAYIGQVDYKKDFNVPTPELPGYTADKTAVTGTMGLEGYSETVTYTPNKYTLTVTYTGVENAPETYTEEIDYDSEFNVPSPEIKGYQADTTVVAGTMNSVEGMNFTVKYTAKKYTLSVVCKYGDTAINTLSQTVEYGTNVTVTAPELAFYKAKTAEQSLTMDDCDAEMVFEYDFDNTPIANPEGVDVVKLPMFNQETGFSITYTLKGYKNSQPDWVPSIYGYSYLSANDPDEKADIFRLYNGCMDSYLEPNTNRTYTGNFRDGNEGNASEYGNSWNALVPYSGTYDITVSFQPDGTIRMYRNGVCALRFDPAATTFNNINNSANTYTVGMFAEAVINYISTYGFKIADLSHLTTDGNPEMTNFSVGPAVNYGNVVVEYKGENGKTIANSITLKEYADGKEYSVTSPEVVAYEVHAENATMTGTVVGGTTTTVTAIYTKVSSIVTVNCYVDTALIMTKDIAVQANSTYTVEVPQIAFYKTEDTAQTLELTEDDVTVDYRGYVLDNTQIVAAPHGQKFGPFPMVNNNTGFSVSFDLAGNFDNDASGRDWVQLFHTTHTLMFNGCIRYMPDGRGSTDWYDGNHGYGESYRNQFGSRGWDNIVPINNNFRVTLSYNPDGSLFFYRDGKLALSFFPTITHGGTDKVSDLVYAFINDVATDGFYINKNFFNNMNDLGYEFTNITNLSVDLCPETYTKESINEPVTWTNPGGGWNGDSIHVIETLTGDFEAVLEFKQTAGTDVWQTPLVVVRDPNEYGNVAVMRQDWWAWIDSKTGTLGTGDVNANNINRFGDPLGANGMSFEDFNAMKQSADVQVKFLRNGKSLSVIICLVGNSGNFVGRRLYVSYCMSNISIDTIQIALSMEFATANVTRFSYALKG